MERMASVPRLMRLVFAAVCLIFTFSTLLLGFVLVRYRPGFSCSVVEAGISE